MKSLEKLTLSLAISGAIALAGCGGAASDSSFALSATCTDASLTPPVLADCSATATLQELVTCLAGTPSACQVVPNPFKPGTECVCSGTGTSIYAATEGVNLCGRNIDQTRTSLLSKLCGVSVTIAAGKTAESCAKAQDYETAVWGQQNTVPLDKKINGADADLLRGGAQAIEAAINASGTDCLALTPAL